VERNPTILVVDDVPLFRELEALFLARCGRVITASSGREALAVAERERPALIVLDAHLPDLSGEEVCRRLKAPSPHDDTPIVVVTGSGAADEHAAAIRAGADDVLAKPLSRMALVETVQRFTRFPEPRGLPRVTLETAVHLRAADAEAWGRSRNLSRGGMFVECEGELGADELDLEFRLPGSPDPLCPTARVIWRRPAAGDLAPTTGLGVRFLELGAPAARQLDAYVHEWAHPDALAFAMPRASGGIT
jgi:CheY-like chemotaxis protein